MDSAHQSVLGYLSHFLFSFLLCSCGTTSTLLKVSEGRVMNLGEMRKRKKERVEEGGYKCDVIRE